MEPLNILVFSLFARGHVYPLMPLCRELSTRGHRVTFVTSEQYVRLIESSGAEALVVDTSPPGDAFDNWWNGLADLPFDSPRWFSPPDEWIKCLHRDTTCLRAALCRWSESRRPDAVLYDQFFYPAYVLSRRFGCPRVRLSAHFANYRGFLIRRNGICMSPTAAVEWAGRLNQFFLEEGVETDGSIWPMEELNIHLIPDAFQYNRALFDERFCFAGRAIARPNPITWDTSRRQEPVVLISGLSGIDSVKHEPPRYINFVFEALADSECHCVLLAEGFEPQLRSLPRNIELCPNASPLEVLPYASALICHGGMGSTLEALYSGVPVLTIPSHPNADEVAYRVSELGLGFRLPMEEVSAERMREKVATILWDDELRKRVRAMQAVFESSTGVTAASDRIERLINAD